MALNESFDRIRRHLQQRYRDNLAGALVLGSSNTGHYAEGVSDINGMVFVTDGKDLDFDDEAQELMAGLQEVRFQTQYVNSLQGIQDYIRRRHSFATWVVIAGEEGSNTLHTTPEFERIRVDLRQNPLTDTEVRKHLEKKRRYELEGYFLKEGRPGQKYGDRPYRETQNLLFYVRRGLQILNFFRTGELVFDFDRCLENSELSAGEGAKARALYQAYADRRVLDGNETRDYYDFAERLTNKILAGAA
ncbi:MAG: hypothetical protein PHF67_04470 [Candidatus Nanoarchaeia archaeon]|nr:hypothetical protein [Candidatus Nanoarchaeia archaeon]